MSKCRFLFNVKQKYSTSFSRTKSSYMKGREVKKISRSVDFFSKKLVLYNKLIRRKFKHKKAKR